MGGQRKLGWEISHSHVTPFDCLVPQFLRPFAVRSWTLLRTWGSSVKQRFPGLGFKGSLRYQTSFSHLPPWSNITEQCLWYPCHLYPVLLTGFGVIFLCWLELNWVPVCELNPFVVGTSAFRILWSLWPWLTGKHDCRETRYCRLRAKWSRVILSPSE